MISLDIMATNVYNLSFPLTLTREQEDLILPLPVKLL